MNVDLPPISLKGNPTLPPVDESTHGSNESWVRWMTRHQKGLGGAPDMLATYIKNFGTDGTVRGEPFDPYANSRDPKLRGKVKAVKIQTDDGHIVDVLYVDPDTSLKPDQRVVAGQSKLGTTADMGKLYGGPITNHVHLQVRKDGRLRDPTSFLKGQ